MVCAQHITSRMSQSSVFVNPPNRRTLRFRWRATIKKGVEIALDGKGDCDRMLNVLWGRPRSAEHLNS